MIRLNLSKNKPDFMLAFSWCFGLILGILSAASASNILIPLMRRAVSSPVSIVGLLMAVYFPFLLSIMAIRFLPSLIYGLSAVKAFCFSYCAYGVYLSFGNAAWLIGFLFLFSEWMLLPVLYTLWLRHISCRKNSLWRDSLVCSVLAIGIFCIDYLWISPYLRRLID